MINEIVDSARALTAARYGAITTIDDGGRLLDFVASGFSPEELKQMTDWPDGWRLFEHLRDLETPLRLVDFADWVRSLGYAGERIPSKTLQATPMRHRDKHLGTFYLGDKRGGGGFTDEDEATLVLFATQAATAIANARAYRAERRARADLEALVETSPVGVVVFDARKNRAVPTNAEARRIVARLLVPDQPPDDLLNVLTCRFGDGRELVFGGRPLVQTLSDLGPIRAERVEFSVPNGRRLTVLVNATPIRSADGTIESIIVTLQDLAPLEELERMRTEFLSMVSHELRAPLAAIKGSTATVLRRSRDLDPAEVRQFFRIVDRQADRMDGLIVDLLDAGRIESGTLTVSPEPLPLTALVDQARNTFLSGGGRHTLDIDLPANLPRVMADQQRITQVLNNLVANAARHSPASSTIRIDAAQDGVHVAVSVSDKGRGVPPEVLPHLFQKQVGMGPGNGPKRAGYGLGLAICKGLVEAHGGRIRAESDGPGQGTRLTFTLPVATGANEVAAGLPVQSRRPANERRERTRILVLDDDPEMLRYVRDALTAADYDVVLSGDPEELPELLRTRQPHLVLLDLVLPGPDGIELMERIPRLAHIPVIFISGYGRDETMARALQAGAADYIVKPFSPTELTARIQAALRVRAGPPSFELAELAIDYDQRRVSLAGRVLELTATEYSLLRVLSLNAGRIMTHESLLQLVWGDKYEDGRHVVRTYVKRLRQKLGDNPSRPTYIFTRVRVGYHMPEPSDPTAPPSAPKAPDTTDPVSK